MAEQLANLYSSTLNTNYVAGHGSISVASATGAPSTGTFTVTILDSSTGDVILVYRVASVSGTTFSGASEGPDANAASGSIVIGTILSAAAVTQLFADHPGSFQTFTAPIFGNFTQTNYNTGSGVSTTQVNNSSPVTSITIKQSDPGDTTEIAALIKSKIASTFTVTIAITFAGGYIGGIGGLILYDGSANAILFGLQSSNGIRAAIFSSLNGSFTADAITAFAAPWVGPVLWLRVQETASARNYYMSSDGITFAQIFTESNTAHFTTADYGMAVESRQVNSNGPDTMITCYSFTETNP